jgi:beta-lactamase superfamily II metal-dependent hydrolase
MKKLLLFILSITFTSIIYGQANGKLQIHFIDVGQGDAAILISPNGEVVLFDDGVEKYCDMPISYIEQLGVKKIDYHIASHYHSDHIGCSEELFSRFPLQKIAFDRGESVNSSVYKRYVKAVGTHRKTAPIGGYIKLDSTSKYPVIISFISMNASGISTTNENDLSLVCLIHFGNFDAEMGGDLSGYKNNSYEDIESTLLGKVKQVELYKVHHHGSQYSSNDKWLSKIKPKVAIISASSSIGHDYGHPTEECMERLHAINTKVYLTENTGSVQLDATNDIVGGNIKVEVDPNNNNFTVNYNWTKVDTYSNWEIPGNSSNGVQSTQDNSSNTSLYGWSKNSNIYHYINCKFISNINPENLQKGNTPPQNKTLHEGCPK